MPKHLLKLLTLGLLITFMSAVALPSATAAKPRLKAKDNPFANIPVAGTVVGGGTVEGLFTIDRFDVVNNRLMAVGTFTGKVGDQKVKDKPLAWPATLQTQSTSAASGTIGAMQAQECPILNLVLGPLHLDLLGLVVDLNQVVLDVTAVPGPGNLLGNLLCAIAGLLDGLPATDLLTRLTQIANLLNAILDLFG